MKKTVKTLTRKQEKKPKKKQDKKTARKSKFDITPRDLQVKRSKTGLGLFTPVDILKGECIIEYFGRLLTEAEEYTCRSKYLFEVNKKMTIDGSIKANTAKYINHSCRPNCEIHIYKRRVYILSKRKIKAGEELLYDYGKSYWNEHIKPKGCKCEKCSDKSDKSEKK